MMDVSTIRKVIEDTISCSNENNFQDFCDRLFLELYKEDYTPVRAAGSNGDDKNDGYCPKARIFVQAYGPSRYEERKVIEKIDADLKGCAEKHSDIQTWIFATNKTLTGAVHTHVDEHLRKQYPAINLQLWDHKKISDEIINRYISGTLEALKLQTIIGKNLDLYKECEELGIIEEIFNFIRQNRKTKKVPDIVDVESASFRKLNDKILLNFTGEQIELVKSRYLDFLGKITSISLFLQRQTEIDGDSVTELKNIIQDDYMFLKDSKISTVPVEDYKILVKLSEEYLPEDKKKSPEFRSNALALVLSFFEICEFGQKEPPNFATT
ncbi:MAG: hypothetical protein WC477_02330 [Patescibacteria group bacterium]